MSTFPNIYLRISNREFIVIRYQLLHGNYQPQPVQQTPASNVGHYQVVAVPAHYQPNVVPVPVQHSHQATHLAQTAPEPTAEALHQPNPIQLGEIAQIASQQYTRINPSSQQHQEQQEIVYPSQQYHGQPEGRAQHSTQFPVPIRSLPPIITGFENFSPEQQEKIKAQLSVHFGGPLTPLPAGRVPQNQGQAKGGSQYSSKYRTPASGLNSNEFIPSEQVKDDAAASSSNVSKPRYAIF